MDLFHCDFHSGVPGSMLSKACFLASFAIGVLCIPRCGEPSQVPVPGGHALYVEVLGNCSGPPLLYFHGGWGPLSGDLDIVPPAFRIVYFHQRGWGSSTPQGSTVNNTYVDVVEDAQLLREVLGIRERWAVFGGSNGATLALMYAARYPQSVAGVVMRGYWAMTPQQVSWDYLGAGKKTTWPEEYRRVCAAINSSGADLLERYHTEFAGPTGDDGCSADVPPAACALGCAWLRWDALGAAIAAVPSDACAHGDRTPEWYQIHPLSASRLGVHFYRRAHIVPDLTSLIASGVGVRFVNGRFDMLCPPGFAAEVVQTAADMGATTWKHTIVEHAAHSGADPGMTVVLQHALAELEGAVNLPVVTMFA